MKFGRTYVGAAPTTGTAVKNGTVKVETPALTDAQLRAKPVLVELDSFPPSSGGSSTGGLTDTELRATPVDVSLGSEIPHVIVDSIPAGSSGLTDDELRASAVPVSLASVPSHAVTGPLTDTQLRLTPVSVSGTVTATTGGLTDTQLRNSAVPVSLASVPSHAVTNAGTFAVQVSSAPTTTVTGPLTDTELRATPVPVSGTVTATTGGLTDTQLRNSAVPVSLASVPSHAVTNAGTFAVQVTSAPSTAVTGPLTDAELRATPVPVSGTVTATTGGLTDTQLRNSAVPVSVATIPSHAVTNAGTFAVQPTGSDLTNVLTATANQKLAVGTYSPSIFKNLGANATLNVKASAGNVYSLSCYNGNAAARYVQLHNTATVPGASDVPVYSFLVPTGSQIVIGTDFFTNEGVNFSTGIAFAFSTALNIYTAGSAGDQSTFVQYK